MAYFRPSMLNSSNLGSTSIGQNKNGKMSLSHDGIGSNETEQEALKGKSMDPESGPVRPLVLFSVDLSRLSPPMQFFVLAGGLILCMCLYGYYQELVIYGWFQRKLSMFSTFMHFLGCFFFAVLQRKMSKMTWTTSNSINSGNSDAISASSGGVSSVGNGAIDTTSASSVISNNSNINSSISNNSSVMGMCLPVDYNCQTNPGFGIITLGTASPRVALMYYALLILVRTAAQGLSNLSMTQINYPAKVLFKSATPVVTMIIGLAWFRKTYPTRDYLVVFLLILGLYVFIMGDASSSPEGTQLGIIYVILSLFCTAAVPMIQEHCMVTYHASIEDLLYHCFLGSTLLSFGMSVVTGEFVDGLRFLIRSGSIHAWVLMISLSMFGFAGMNFSAGLTLQYGSLVNGITNTFRKVLTLILSFALFPERNVFNPQMLFGTLIFFSGLLIRIFSKASPSSSSSNTSSSSSTSGSVGWSTSWFGANGNGHRNKESSSHYLANNRNATVSGSAADLEWGEVNSALDPAAVANHNSINPINNSNINSNSNSTNSTGQARHRSVHAYNGEYSAETTAAAASSTSNNDSNKPKNIRTNSEEGHDSSMENNVPSPGSLSAHKCYYENLSTDFGTLTPLLQSPSTSQRIASAATSGATTRGNSLSATAVQADTGETANTTNFSFMHFGGTNCDDVMDIGGTSSKLKTHSSSSSSSMGGGGE